jgi:hypothetical protein
MEHPEMMVEIDGRIRSQLVASDVADEEVVEDEATDNASAVES